MICIFYNYVSGNLLDVPLLFSIMNIVSSCLWITYSQMKKDTPLLIRGSSDLILFSISTMYIMSNRTQMNKIQNEIIE